MINPDRLTVKASEALNAAINDARRLGNPLVYDGHLLLGLLAQEEGIVVPILHKLGVNVTDLRDKMLREIERYPKQSGGSGPTISRELNRVFDQAEKDANELGDEYVSTEHLLLALTGVKATESYAVLQGLGVTRDGALARLVRVPAQNCIAAPSGLDAEIVALTEPMTVSAEAVDTSAVRTGDRVLVLGPGNIGQGVALLARAAGAAQVVIVGSDDALRLDVLRRMGFADTVDSGGRTLTEALAPYLAQGKFDVVIEATGVPEVVQQALDVLRRRGILVVAGIHPRAASIDLTRLVREHQQIRGTYRAPIATWSRVIDFLGRNADLVGNMISHRVPLARALDGFELARNKAASKVLIVP